MRVAERLETGVRRVLAPADALMNRLYGWRFNPLYHSGALVVFFFVVILVTGLYLIFFYRIGSPHASIVRLDDQVWLGRWIRTLHRYASDAAVVAVIVHVFRMFAERRSWGPRALAWITGVILLFVTLVCGWTGYVMVWDTQGFVLAREGARLLDAIPIFAEPISRAFTGERAIPSAFFFLNLFLHVALPIGLGVLLWVHVSRVARAALLPPRGLMWGSLGVLLLLSLLWPAAIGPAADLLRLPDRAPYDVFYSFWLPVSQALSAGAVWITGGVLTAIAIATPWWAAPSPVKRPKTSYVNQQLCDACEQCYLDCPYEAIAMVELAGSRNGMVAEVNPSLCVGCAICAGSCAPMGVGPPGRTGRTQLQEVKEFLATRNPGPQHVVIVGCTSGTGGLASQRSVEGAMIYPVHCAGSVHTSVIEYLVRSGVAGVLIVACPPRDCWHREGPKWLHERLYNDREAELKPRVDRNRVRVAYAGLGESRIVLQALGEYKKALAELEEAKGEVNIELDVECEAEEVSA